MIHAQTSQLQIGEWLVTPALDLIERGGSAVKLEPRTMRLLMRLSEAPGEVVSGQQLLDDVWAGVVVSSQSVYQAISQLRKLLGDVEQTPTYIATVPRKGYRLVAPVQQIDKEPAAAVAAAADRNGVAPTAEEAPSTPLHPQRRRTDTRAAAMRRAIAAAAVVLLIAALSYLSLREDWGADAGRTAVVVLPFVDLTEGSKDEALTDGLTEELSTSLSQLPALRVIARTSAYAVREQKLDARQIGAKLAASHIIEGTVRRSGGAVRVTAQLVDARRGHRSWSAAYDVPAQDVMRLQRDIAQAIAQTLDVRFSTQDSRRLLARSPKSAEAYEAYLLGRYYFRQRTSEANSRAVELYGRALAFDPRFALAHVGLAQARFNEYALTGRPLSEVADEVEALVGAALELNETLAEAYATRGVLNRERNLLDAATRDLRRTIELNPSNVTAHASMGRVFQLQGRSLEAAQQFTLAQQLDPFDFMRYVQLCDVLVDVARYAEAEANCARARDLQPASEWPWLASIWLARAQGRLAAAIRWGDEGLRRLPNSIELRVQRVDDLMALGMTQNVQASLRESRELDPEGVFVPLSLGNLQLAARDKTAARETLRRLPLNAESSAADLLDAARLGLMTGDIQAASRFAALAHEAPDAARIESMQRIDARFGWSDELTLALLDQHRGEHAAAELRAKRLLRMLGELERNGQRTWGLYSLRAEALALLKRDDEALESLRRAVDLGWREVWRSMHGPLGRILGRDEGRALVRRVEDLNAAERRDYAASISVD